MKRLSFPKSKRLRTSEQFKAVLAQRRRFSDALLVLYIAKNSCDYSRLGVSVGKKCGNAVMRNRLKRLLREAFRQSQQVIPECFDYVAMISPIWLKELSSAEEPKKLVKSLPFERVKASLLALAANAE